MNRKILYYPSILVPTNWLKQALLYWDNISSIVPHQFSYEGINGDRETESVKSMLYLKEIGIFEESRPESALGQISSNKLDLEFIKTLESKNFNKIGKSTNYWEMYKSKMSYTIYSYLKDKGLIHKDHVYSDTYLLESNTASLYMGLLANYIAENNIHYMVTSTNDNIYQHIAYSPQDFSSSYLAYNIDMTKILPVPSEDVSLKQIVNFKNKRSDELIHFRKVMDDFIASISKVNDKQEVKLKSVAFSEMILSKAKTLGRLLSENRIRYYFSSLNTLMDVKSPPIYEGILASILPIDPLISIPVIATTACVKVGAKIVSNRCERNAKIRENAFSYIYYAQKAKILKN